MTSRTRLTTTAPPHAAAGPPRKRRWLRWIAVAVAGKPQPQVATSLRTGQYPDATFTLAAPVPLSRAFAAGGTASFTATGLVAMNGASHQVTVTVARRDGTTLQVAGSIPVTFSAWHIKGPSGFGFLGSLADHGIAEFLLTLRQP